MLGISWGIVSVVMLLAYGEGFNAALLRGLRGRVRRRRGDHVSAGRRACRQAASAPASACGMRLADAEAVGEVPLHQGSGARSSCRTSRCAWGTKQASYLRPRGRALLRA